jgi:hypothetical protein
MRVCTLPHTLDSRPLPVLSHVPHAIITPMSVQGGLIIAIILGLLGIFFCVRLSIRSIQVSRRQSSWPERRKRVAAAWRYFGLAILLVAGIVACAYMLITGKIPHLVFPTAPTATPTRTATELPPTRTNTNTPSHTNTQAPSDTPAPSPTPTPTETVNPLSTWTPKPTDTRWPTYTPSRTSTPTLTPFPSGTPTMTSTYTHTRTPLPTDTHWPSPTPLK